MGKRSSFSTMSEPNWHIPAEPALHVGSRHSPEKERPGRSEAATDYLWLNVGSGFVDGILLFRNLGFFQ
jgi:hypothetical protein